MSAPPWTAGPWRTKPSDWYDGGCIVEGPNMCGLVDGTVEVGQGDASLIALAPEMAEAILAFAESSYEEAHLRKIDLGKLAAKLRAIGEQ